MAGKSSIREQILTHAGYKPLDNDMSLPTATITMHDALMFMQGLAYTGNSGQMSNGQIIRSINKIIAHSFQRSDNVALVFDQDEYVPAAKGPVQSSRRRVAALLSANELAQRFNENLIPAHNKAVEMLQIKARQEAETRERYSFVNDDPEHVVLQKLGFTEAQTESMSVAERRIAVLERSAEHPVPQPWQLAVDFHNNRRRFTIPYIVQMMTLVPDYLCPIPFGGHLIVDGHYCQPSHFEGEPQTFVSNVKNLQNTPLVIRPISSGLSVPVLGLSKPIVQTSMSLFSDGSKTFDFSNTLGEAEPKFFNMISKLHSNRDVALDFDRCSLGPCYKIASTDTDVFVMALFYLGRHFYFQNGACAQSSESDLLPPLVVIEKRIKQKSDYCIMNDIFHLLDAKLNGETICRSTRAMRYFSFLAVGFALDSDYTVGYNWIVAKTLYSTFQSYMADIGPLVSINQSCGQSRAFELLQIDCGAFQRLVIYSYYSAHKKLFDAANRALRLSFPHDITVDLAQTITANIPKDHLGLLDNPLIPLEGFRVSLSQLSKRFPPLEQLAARMLLVQYYLSMVSQVGSNELVLLNPLDFGYQKIDPTLPTNVSNLAFVASHDYENLTARREQLLQEHYPARPT